MPSYVLIAGIYRATPHTVLDGKLNEIAVDSQGRLIVTGVSGSPVFVELSAALPAGTNEIGKVTTNIQPPLQWPGISGDGRSLLFGTIAQGAAGTTQLVAADADELYYVVAVSLTMSLAGTVKFTDGTVDLTGAMDADAVGWGFVDHGTPFVPLFKTAAINRPLNIVTTGGAAKGYFSYIKATS